MHFFEITKFTIEFLNDCCMRVTRRVVGCLARAERFAYGRISKNVGSLTNVQFYFNILMLGLVDELKKTSLRHVRKRKKRCGPVWFSKVYSRNRIGGVMKMYKIIRPIFQIAIGGKTSVALHTLFSVLNSF